MAIKEFSKDVMDQIGYYVYRLIDPRDGQTFYVGKGKGNRVFNHVNDALNGHYEEDEDDASAKIKQIREIRNAGLEVIHIIQRWGIKDEKTAFEVESALIDCFPGLTNIQSGHHDDYGVINAEELQRTLSVKEYEEPDFSYIIIKINSNILSQRDEDIYETVRSAWKVSKDKVEQYKYVLAVKNGIVVGVYEPEYWQLDSGNDTGRYEFVGKEAPEDIKVLFMNKKIPARYSKKGMASPVLYSDGICK